MTSDEAAEEIEEFLARVRNLELDDAVFAVLVKFDALLRARELSAANRILAKADVSGMSEDLIVAFLTATAPIKRKLLPQRFAFYARVREVLADRGLSASDIAEILEGLG